MVRHRRHLGYLEFVVGELQSVESGLTCEKMRHSDDGTMAGAVAVGRERIPHRPHEPKVAEGKRAKPQ